MTRFSLGRNQIASRFRRRLCVVASGTLTTLIAGFVGQTCSDVNLLRPENFLTSSISNMNCQIENTFSHDEDASAHQVPSPSSEPHLSRKSTEKSAHSSGTALDTPSNSFLSKTEPTTRPSRFRPRFADEGLEDLHSDATDNDISSETEFNDVVDTDFETYMSSDLNECIKVAEEMEKEIVRQEHGRGVYMRTDLYRD